MGNSCKKLKISCGCDDQNTSNSSSYYKKEKKPLVKEEKIGKEGEDITGRQVEERKEVHMMKFLKNSSTVGNRVMEAQMKARYPGIPIIVTDVYKEGNEDKYKAMSISSYPTYVVFENGYEVAREKGWLYDAASHEDM